MSMEERSARRRRTMKTHVAKDFADADRWDLAFWQERTPEERLSALIAIRKDVEKIEDARENGES